MTINLTTSFTIEAGQTYSGVSGAVFYMEQYPPDFWFRNYGTIHAAGSGVIGFLGWNAKGNFLNAGLIRVDSTGSHSYALRFEAWAPTVLNTGRIELNGRGTAVKSWSPNQEFHNEGVIIATDQGGGGNALSFINGVRFSNTGQILAYGPGAQAIYIEGFHNIYQTGPTTFTKDGYFENNGTIIASTTEGGPTYAIAINSLPAIAEPVGPNLVNTGFMQADRVIWWVGSPNLLAAEWVENRGEMLGDIFLDNGNDRFINTGLYVGHIDMGRGDDIVDLSRGTGRASIELDEGNDTAFGNAEGDEIDGGSGVDFIDGGEGADWLYGSDGDDHVIGGAGNDTLIGGFQQDLLDGGDGDDVLIGDVDYRTQFSWLCSDRLFGGAGNDILRGGQNDDYLDGGTGEDTAFYYGVRGSYEITTLDGITTIRGGEGVDTLVGIERLEFFDGVYTIGGVLLSRSTEGLSTDDTLTGNADANRMRGGDGDDVFNPGEGNDMIDGGAGDDVVWFDGRIEDYKIVRIGDDFLVASHYDNSDYLTNVETIRFRQGGGVVELNRVSDGREILPGGTFNKDESPPAETDALFGPESWAQTADDDHAGRHSLSQGFVDPVDQLWFL